MHLLTHGQGIRSLLLCLLLSFTTMLCAQTIVYVDASANGQNSGTSWEDAFIDLQDALAAVSDGSEIWVAAGIYKPTQDPSARSARFELKNQVSLFGGFVGIEGGRDERDWQQNPTILSGDINNSGNWDGNSYQVVAASNRDASAVLDGFIVQRGAASGPGNLGRGGGMANFSSTPTIRNLVFSENHAMVGAGMYNLSSSPTLVNVSFQDNMASQEGGGLANELSHPTLINVSFRTNVAGSRGGGMYNESSNPTLTNTVFAGNRAGGLGGGLANLLSDPVVVNALFSGNVTFAHGGAIANMAAMPQLTNVTIGGNFTVGGGAGGIHNLAGSEPVLRNSVIWGNGSAFTSIGSDVSIFNDMSTARLAYSLVQGCKPAGLWDDNCGSDDGGNLADVNPRFVMPIDPEDASSRFADLRLQLASPAANMGNNDWIDDIDFDLDGNPRIQFGTVDLGAFEIVPLLCPDSGVLHVDQNAAEPGRGQDWNAAFTDLQNALQVTEPCEIWIAAGTYLPSPDPLERTASFLLKNRVALYGGFSGDETFREQRRWQTNPTILSGDINASNELAGNSFQVLLGDDVDSSAVLDGFTVTGGNADGEGQYAFGGGLLNLSGSPTIRQVLFIGNQASAGGGMFNFNNSNPSLTSVSFTDNHAFVDGGGMYNQSSSPQLNDVTFNACTAGRDGGGMFNARSNPVLADAAFIGNSAANLGGGMFNVTDSNPHIMNAAFIGNVATSHGGGMFNFLSGPQLINVVFSGNASSSRGGGLANEASSPQLTNVSFSGNSAAVGGGLSNVGNSAPALRNSLIWNNRDSSGADSAQASVANQDSIPLITYTLVQGCNPGGHWNPDCGADGGDNLVDADPLFLAPVDPEMAPTLHGNLRLAEASPAVNAGNNDFVDKVAYDLDGSPRIVGDQVDLGPYETLLNLIFRDRFEQD